MANTREEEVAADSPDQQSRKGDGVGLELDIAVSLGTRKLAELRALWVKRSRERGLLLWLVGLQPEVLATVRRSPLGETLGRERMFFNLE